MTSALHTAAQAAPIARMDMMDHTGHMRTGGAFIDTNMSMARSYWYIIAALCGFMFCLRINKFIETRARYALSPAFLPIET